MTSIPLKRLEHLFLCMTSGSPRKNSSAGPSEQLSPAPPDSEFQPHAATPPVLDSCKKVLIMCMRSNSCSAQCRQPTQVVDHWLTDSYFSLPNLRHISVLYVGLWCVAHPQLKLRRFQVSNINLYRNSNPQQSSCAFNEFPEHVEPFRNYIS